MSTRIARHRGKSIRTGLLVVGALALAGLGISTAAADTTPPAASSPESAQEVQQTLAQYVRGTDHRDGAAVSGLFTSKGAVEILAKNSNGAYKPVASPIVGRDAINNAVTHMQAPLTGLASEHHVTSDPTVSVKGHTAHLNVQFITYAVQGASEPAGGWPAGTAGAQGTIKPYESGYYDAELRRVDGDWQITNLRILHDLPIIIPSS
ncbi:nuclear transport factor 2 family protein [Streptomyces sp. NPDC026665]|uniref:nuclear transport factor 2 family protein n=1 Tax=Streptomyces sp. NPDC026665 TaxID=3154798 RepID=UPI0033F496DF